MKDRASKAIIFGVNSQDGYYLSKVLSQKNIIPVGVSRSDTGFLRGDVSDFFFVENCIKSERPEYVFHIAANSTTNHFALVENHETISTGTINILESVKKHTPDCKVFITGSGVQFKNTGNPIKETDIFEASSAYSVARIQSVYAARYFRSLGIKTYVGYLFHHESPRRKTHHVSKKIVDFIKSVEQGNKDKIVLGDISVQKEWAFAGDIAEGIYQLINQDSVFEAAIGTGKSYSIQDWLEICFKIKDKNWRDYVTANNGNFTPEYKRLVSNPETINSIGWKDSTSIEELAQMMLV